MKGVFPQIASALAVVSMALATGACSSQLSGLDPLQGHSAIPEYHIDSGDKLRIVVQDMKDLSTDYVVDETGVIAMPLIKEVGVRDKTLREAEREIERILQANKILNTPKVSVQPLDLRPLYVMGEVNRPGEYTFRQGMTVFAAISVAGGFTYRANSGRVAITRTVAGKQVTGTGTDATPVMPGDRIRVVERWF
jgi:polysaccharide export outer membrane protein